MWNQDYEIPGIEAWTCIRFIARMGVAGRSVARGPAAGATPFAPRCTKDAIEEALFDRRRDLFSHLDLVFFDTTFDLLRGPWRGGTGAIRRTARTIARTASRWLSA